MTAYSYTIERSSVVLTVTGLTTDFSYSLGGQTGAFAINAVEPTTNLLLNSRLSALYDSNAQFALSGSNLTTTGNFSLTATTAPYALTGYNLGVAKAYAPSLASGAFTLTGQNLTAFFDQAGSASKGTFLLTGSATTLRITKGILVAQRGFVGLTGLDLTATRLASTIFPALRPTRREFIPPVHSISSTRSINGLTYRRLHASVPSGAELRLTYENLPEADANTLLALYDTALGTYRSVTLPSETMAGAEPELQAYLNLTGTDQRWAFTGPPSMESVAPGVHTVNLTLQSRIVPTGQRPSIPELPACDVPVPNPCYPNVGAGGPINPLLGALFPTIPPPTPPEPAAPVALPSNGTVTNLLPGQTLDYFYDPPDVGAPTVPITIRTSGTASSSGTATFYRTYTTKIAYTFNGVTNYESSYFGNTGGSFQNVYWGQINYSNISSPSASLTFNTSYGVIISGGGAINGVAQSVSHSHTPIPQIPGIYYTDLVIDIVWS